MYFRINGVPKQFTVPPGASLAASATKAALAHCKTALLLGRGVVVTATEGNVVRRFIVKGAGIK